MSEQNPTLTKWIKTATAGLPPSAVSRLSAEINDHAAESRRKHVTEGMSDAAADEMAIRELGDAHQRAAEFREAHFSRGLYTRGAVLLLAQLFVMLVWLAGPAISNSLGVYGTTDEKALIAHLMLLWGIIESPISSILGILIARTLLTFLRE